MYRAVRIHISTIVLPSMLKLCMRLYHARRRLCRPQCQILVENAICCANCGIVAAASFLSAAVLCTEDVQIPADCLTVSGPSPVTVYQTFGGAASGMAFEYIVNWNSAFVGNVTIDLQAARCGSFLKVSNSQ